MVRLFAEKISVEKFYFQRSKAYLYLISHCQCAVHLALHLCTNGPPKAIKRVLASDLVCYWGSKAPIVSTYDIFMPDTDRYLLKLCSTLNKALWQRNKTLENDNRDTLRKWLFALFFFPFNFWHWPKKRTFLGDALHDWWVRWGIVQFLDGWTT